MFLQGFGWLWMLLAGLVAGGTGGNTASAPAAAVVGAAPSGDTTRSAPGAVTEAPCKDGLPPPFRVQIGTVEAAVGVGRELPLPIRAKGVCGVAGFQFGVVHNSDVVSLVRVEQTPFLAGAPPVDVEFLGLDPSRPSRRIMASRPAGTGGVDGFGTLARLIFRGLRPGVTRVDLTALHLYDAEGRDLPCFSVPLRLTVVDNFDLNRRPGASRRARPDQD